MPKQQILSNEKRNEIESLIYRTFDAVDKTKTNSDYYRKLFADMSNDQFYKFLQRRLPFRFHTEIFKVEPKMYEIFDGFKVLGKPLVEKVNLPHEYINSEGVPVKSQEAMVVYIHLKRMKQVVIHKSSLALDTNKRDMKTGLLIGSDKGAKETDREFESLAIQGLSTTMDEFARPKADAMRAAAQMNNAIATKGFVSEKDFTVADDDSLAKNMLNVYLIGANIHSNLVDVEYMTPYTAKNKQRAIERV